MLEPSPLVTGLIITLVGTLIAGLGWLITSQIATNKGLLKAIIDLSDGLNKIVVEFKGAIALIEERSTSQKMLCQEYRNRINDKQKSIDIELKKFETKVENHINH